MCLQISRYLTSFGGGIINGDTPMYARTPNAVFFLSVMFRHVMSLILSFCNFFFVFIYFVLMFFIQCYNKNVVLLYSIKIYFSRKVVQYCAQLNSRIKVCGVLYCVGTLTSMCTVLKFMSVHCSTSILSTNCFYLLFC